MRLLRRNTTKVDYYEYEGLQTDLNEDGLHTGEFEPAYFPTKTLRGTISVPSGRAIQMFDGLNVQYSYVMVIDDSNPGLDEAGKIVWNNKVFDIVAIRSSLNFTTIALKENTTDHFDQYIFGDEEPTPEEPEEPDEPGNQGEPGEPGDNGGDEGDG